MNRIRKTLLTATLIVAVLMAVAPVYAIEHKPGGEIVEFLADGEKIHGFQTFNFHVTRSGVTLGKIITHTECEMFGKHYQNGTYFQLIVFYQLDDGSYVLAQFNHVEITAIGHRGKGAYRYSIQTSDPVIIHPWPI